MLTKYREQIAYLFFGGCTTLISWGVATVLFYYILGESYNLLSNIIAEVIAITFAILYKMAANVAEENNLTI